MASQKPTLNVILSPGVNDQLKEIWRWNSQRYDASHADEYLDFLKSKINALSTEYPNGKRVNGRSHLRYMIIKRKSGGHGHIAVFSLEAGAIYLIYVFHTAQDWRTKLLNEE